ncbi:unnamed protein product [Schistosoma margrebowiei]|uniref:Uncharacterized protein n=1 Tax=Schistosoma margrebowiei TaxID=48269 RepID=A0A183MCE8_9TREM|nr:unnamed protein product [Schistosoma margrebowiei]
MKLKLKQHWTIRQTVLKRFNTACLRHTDNLNQFKVTRNISLQALQDQIKEDTNMENNWNVVKEALSSTCQKVLGLKNHHHHKEWISSGTLDKIQEKKKTAINNSRTRTAKVKA